MKKCQCKTKNPRYETLEFLRQKGQTKIKAIGYKSTCRTCGHLIGWYRRIPEDKKNGFGGDHYKRHGEYQPWNGFPKLLSEEELLGYAKSKAIAYIKG